MKHLPIRVIVDNLPQLMLKEEIRIRAGESIEGAFPYLRDPVPSIGSQFAEPAEVLRATVRWIWLAVHAGVSATAITSMVNAVVARSVEASKLSGGRYLRADHDVFLMLCSVLCGDDATMKLAARSVAPSQPSIQSYQFMEAWTGILAGEINGNIAEQKTQLMVLLRNKPLSSYRCPSHVMAEAFVNHDYDGLKKAILKSYSKEWRSLQAEHSLTDSASGDRIVDISGRPGNRYWPWAEAVFGKLAHKAGARIEPDPLWLPKALLDI